MTDCKFFDASGGQSLAYHALEGKNPGVVFLGGFKSDMEGSKATFLHNLCKKQGRSFLRFDYSGHGKSSGKFTDGCIGDWARDALDIISALCEGPQIIVGSSMGGWIGLLLARQIPERFKAFIGVAAAPDFTEDSIWAGLDEAQRATLMAEGHIELPSEYDDSPYVFTRHLIEDGRQNLLLRAPLPLPFPVRLLQGTEDASVAQSVPLRLLEHATGGDIRLTLVKGADHSFSSPRCLALIEQTLAELMA